MYRREDVISIHPLGLISGTGLEIGESITGRPVSIPGDQLARHMLVLGKTGTGKSNLLKLLVSGILESGEGSIVVFDPHGDLGKTIACNYPESTLVISPHGLGDGEDALNFTFNAIHVGEKDEQNYIAAGWVKDVFASENVFSRGTWGPRLEVIFTSMLLELMDREENVNLSDLLDLLLDQSRVRRFISSTGNPQLKAFLKMQVSDWKNWNQYVSSSINKLLPLLNDRGIRLLISGRRDSMDLMGFLEEGSHIVIPEVWKEVATEDTYRIISVLLLLKLWLQRINSRAGPGKPPVYLIFDEAQIIPPQILDRFLREGRKFGFRIIMATQFMGSESRNLSETVRGNVSTVVGFNLSESEAESISLNFFSGQVSRTLVNVLKSQPLHRGVVWSQDVEGTSGPLSFSPHLRDMEMDDSSFRRIRDRDLARYGTPSGVRHEEPGGTDLHEFLIQEFQKFLQKKGLETDRNMAVGGIYPDLMFNLDGTTVYVEVEVSDLLNFTRIMDKVANYAGKKLMFLTPPGTSGRLFSSILSYLARNDAAFHSRLGKEKSDILSQVTILEYEGSFRFLAGGRLRQFRLDHMKLGSYMGTLRELPYPEVRSFIYGRMVSERTFGMEFPEERLKKVFGAENTLRAHKLIVGNTTFISIQDLFIRGPHDSPPK